MAVYAAASALAGLSQSSRPCHPGWCYAATTLSQLCSQSSRVWQTQPHLGSAEFRAVLLQNLPRCWADSASWCLGISMACQWWLCCKRYHAQLDHNAYRRE